jgi:hypothetical protein
VTDDRPARTAQETIARNTTVLVWALVWVPLGAVVLYLLVLVGNWTFTLVQIPGHERDYAAVTAEYQAEGYQPPNMGEQIMQVCGYLHSGMGRDQAASTFATGTGLSTGQAGRIVAAIADNECAG